jgi:hypothetical protein
MKDFHVLLYLIMVNDNIQKGIFHYRIIKKSADPKIFDNTIINSEYFSTSDLKRKIRHNMKIWKTIYNEEN